MLRWLTATRAVNHVGGFVRTLLHAPRSRRRSIAAATLGALALVGSLLVATPAQALNDTGTGGVFTPATGRILDTAKGTGGFSTPMEAGKYRTIKVTGLAGVPDDGSVGAVSLNATVGTAPGNGTLFGRPDADTSRTSMLIYNGNTGEYVSNTAAIAVGADGTIQIMAETSARVILDVQGYYTANTDGTAAGGFVPVAGKRFVDTRSGLGAPKATIAPGKSVDVQVTGANDVPAGASGVVVNLIAINSTSSDGNLTPYATGSTKPQNSLHYTPSATTSIQAQVGLSADGKMTIANASSTVNLVIDLQGYFTAAGKTGAVFTPGVGRAYDSRATGNAVLAKNETRSIQIAGKAGVPVMGSGITAVVLTLIVAHGGSDGRAAVWADGAAKPDTTSINFQADEIRTNTVTVPLGANGKISLNNVADPTNYVIDVQGWYANPQAPLISCEGVEPDSWNAQVGEDDIPCDITFAPTSSSAAPEITIDGDVVQAETIDDVPGAALNLSSSSETTVAQWVGDDAGVHTIEATDPSGARAVFSFGVGDWSASPIAGVARAIGGDVTNNLSVMSTLDQIPNGATVQFHIVADGQPIADSSVIEFVPGDHAAEWSIPSGVLVEGRQYTWYAAIDAVSRPAVGGLPAGNLISVRSDDYPLTVTPPAAPEDSSTGTVSKESPRPGTVSTQGYKLCLYELKTDKAHKSKSKKYPKGEESVHGSWKNHGCDYSGKAHVHTVLQRSIEHNWKTIGTPGDGNYKAGGGAGKRATARHICTSEKEYTYRGFTTVNIPTVKMSITTVSGQMNTDKCG
jgi:hypothetical protein